MTETIKLSRWLTPLLLASTLATPARTLRAAAYTWQGPGNIWSAAGNWMPAGGPPGTNAADTAAINSGPAITLDVNETIAGLTMNSAAAFLSIPANQTLTVNGPAMLTQGRITLTGGTLAGTGTLTITNLSSVTASGTGSTINNPITLSGTMNIVATATGPGNLTLAKDLTNNGTIQMTVPAGGGPQVSLTINGGNGTLTNNGIINFSANAVPNSISAALVNNASGQINVNGSTLLGSAGVKSSNLGTITIAAGKTLALLGASFINDRTPTAKGMIVGAGTLSRTSIPAGGWTNNGAVTVANVVAPQAQGIHALTAYQPGLLNFVGDYVQSSSGELDIPINQHGVAGTDYSQLMITQGAAILDGMLNVTVNNPGAISYGDVFTVLTSDSGLSGYFANAVPDASGMGTLVADGGTFTVLYLGSAGGPSDVELTNFVSSVPEPPSLHLLASGAGVVGLVVFERSARRRRRNRSACPSLQV
jgi:hypothetical protein